MATRAVVRFHFKNPVRETRVGDKRVMYFSPDVDGIWRTGRAPPRASDLIDLMKLPLISKPGDLCDWSRDFTLEELVEHTGPLALEYHMSINGRLAWMCRMREEEPGRERWYTQVFETMALFEELASDNELERISVLVYDNE